MSKTPTTPLDRIAAAAAAIRDATDERAQAMIDARAAGYTWRRIADAGATTQQGARITIAAYEKRRAEAPA
jgi:hypothetical protein